MRVYNWFGREDLDDYSESLTNHYFARDPSMVCLGPCQMILNREGCQCEYFCQKCWVEKELSVSAIHACDYPHRPNCNYCGEQIRAIAKATPSRFNPDILYCSQECEREQTLIDYTELLD